MYYSVDGVLLELSSAYRQQESKNPVRVRVHQWKTGTIVERRPLANHVAA